MNKEQLKKAIEVMQAAYDGKPIEFRRLHQPYDHWQLLDDPCWNFYRNEYRIGFARPSIDWKQVSSLFNYMATDRDGETYLYSDKPRFEKATGFWISGVAMLSNAAVFDSFKRGNYPCEDSLVERPQ